MAKKYGFYTGDLEILPYLSGNTIREDCAADLIPKLFRRPGAKTFFIIPLAEVEPYYELKGIPREVINEKLRELKIQPRAKRESLIKELMGNHMQVPTLSAIQSL